MRKCKKSVCIVIVLTVLMSVLTAGIIQASAFTGHEQVTDVQRLFSEANTFDCTKIDKTTHPDRYEVEYDMTARNGKQVMDKPQITVLTHGWGMAAGTWSNNYCHEIETETEDEDLGNEDIILPTDPENCIPFSYDKDSIISRLNEEVNGANIFWAEMKGEKFYLFDITGEKEQFSKYAEKYNHKKVEQITDISKHIVVVFQADDSGQSHNNIYYQFNYIISSIVNNVKVLNGGILPKLNLIAHSRGGITNMQYALDHPDLVASLISMGTPYFGSTTAKIAGALLFGNNNGLEDILNPELYYGYSNRWNTDYERLYKDINAVAIGGYSTFLFLNNVVENDYSNYVKDYKDLIKFLIPVACLGNRNLHIKFLVSAILKKILQENVDKFSDEDIADIVEIWLTEIDANSFIPSAAWYNDILVPLDSQLAKDNGSANYSGGTYKGFKHRTRCYNIWDDIDFTKMATVGPPVPHNLEPRDPKIIDMVLDELTLGVQEPHFRFRPLSETEIEITGYSNPMAEELVIPSEIDGKRVTAIAQSAFADRPTKTVRIPSSVKKIDVRAFENCTQLQSVVFDGESELATISYSAFCGCESLSSFDIPSSVTGISSYAFYGCKSLAGSVGLPAGLEYFGVGAFAECGGVTEFELSEINAEYKTVGGVLYNKAENRLICYPSGRTAAEFDVPLSVGEIAEFAFAGNKNLQKINLNRASFIRDGAFMNCINLSEIIGENTAYVDAFSLVGTMWLSMRESDETISLGGALYRYNGSAARLDLSAYKSVSPFAFVGNQMLREVTFGNNAMTIGNYAFKDCASLETVNIRNLDNVVSVGTAAFDGNRDGRKIYVPSKMRADYEKAVVWDGYADGIDVHKTALNFVADGSGFSDGEGVPNEIEYGGEIAFAAPSKTGYTFGGWFAEPACETRFLDGTAWTSYAETSNIYAKWTPITYSIVLDTDGVLPTHSVLYFTVEDETVLPVPTKTGHTFGGWFESRDFLPSERVEKIPVGSVGNKTLYSLFAANTYAVTYDYGVVIEDGKIIEGAPNTDAVTYGQTYSLFAPVCEDYVFNGWKDGDGRLVANENGGATLLFWDIPSDTTLTASWTRITYRVMISDDNRYYWADVGSEISFEPCEIDVANILDVDKLVRSFYKVARNNREGHIFSSFTANEADGYKSINTLNYYLEKIKAGETIELVAHYEKEINFSVAFEGVEVVGGVNPYQCNYKDKIVYPEAAKKGYKFEYWAVSDTAANDKFAGTSLAVGTIFDYDEMPDLSVGYEQNGVMIWLTPIFSAKEYTFEFVSEYGQQGETVIKRYYYDSDTDFQIPACVGREFLGWFTNGNVKIEDGEWEKIDGYAAADRLTLYAHWHTVEYNIVYHGGDGYRHSGKTKFTVDELPVTLGVADCDDKRFAGWYTSAEFAGNSIDKISAVGDVTLYPKFLQIYYLDFDSRCDISVGSLSGVTGEEVILPTVARDGYRGTWAYNDGKNESNFGTTYVIGNSDVRFWAEWTRTRFLITFDKMGGTGGTDGLIVNLNEKVESIIIPRRKGYVFDGYFTKSGEKVFWHLFQGGNMDYAFPCGSGYFDCDMTLYAHWHEMSWSVSISIEKDNAGESEHDVIYLSGNETRTYVAPDIADYDYDGWTYRNESKVLYTGKEKNIDLTGKFVHGYFDYFLTLKYKYNPSSCVAAGTLITLADGRQVPVETLTGEEMLLVWNLKTGAFDSAPILFIDSDAVKTYEVVNLKFSDGTTVKVISEHAFFDLDSNKYVRLDKHAAAYVGHRFAKGDGKTTAWVELAEVVVKTEVAAAFSPVTFSHLCYYVNGMLSIPGGISGLYNIFEVNAETMTVDVAAYEADVKRYGLYTYEEFVETVAYVPETAFEALNGKYLKVSVGKGLITKERIAELASRYAPFFGGE